MSSAIELLIGFFGSQQKTAEKLKVSQATVSGWLNEKHGMHPVTAMKAETLTGGKVKATDLCPRLNELNAVSKAA